MELEEAIEYLEQFIGIKKEYKYKPIKVKTMINTRKVIETVLKELEENSIPKKKIEDILKKLDSKKVEERIIKFYTPDKKHYYETDKYNDIIKQFLQKLLEDK